MGFLKKIFGENKHTQAVRPDIHALLESGNTDQLIIDLNTYVCKLCAYGDVLQNLSGQQKIFYFNQSLEMEVNNGGFDQYFFNSSGNFANETVASLQMIGAYKTAAILQLAIEQFPNAQVPPNNSDRRLMLEYASENAEEIWEDLTKQFLKYEDNLSNLNIKFIKENETYF